MKVLDAKQWPPARPAPFQRTCSKCSSLLEIEVEDVLAHTAGRTGDNYAERENYTCLYVQCPQCSQHIAVGEAGRAGFGTYWDEQILQRSGMG
jgi:hypothetical protein